MGSTSTKRPKERWVLFKRLIKRGSLRWKFLGKRKRLNLQTSFFDDVLFMIVSSFEAVVLEDDEVSWGSFCCSNYWCFDSIDFLVFWGYDRYRIWKAIWAPKPCGGSG